MASASTIMMATSASATTGPAATTMSNTAPSMSRTVGNATHWPTLFSVDQADAHAADRAAERQAGDLGGGEAALMAKHVVQVLGLSAQDGDDDLDLVAQAVDERRRSGRSMSRQVRIASVGRAASRRKNEPGIGRLRTCALRRRRSAGRSRSVPSAAWRLRWWTAAWSIVEVGDDRAGGLQSETSGFEPMVRAPKLLVVDDGGGFAIESSKSSATSAFIGHVRWGFLRVGRSSVAAGCLPARGPDLL